MMLRGDPRPLFRGYLHLAAAFAAPAGLVALLLLARSPSGYVGASIFGASLILLYATSASYHLLPWGPRLRPLMMRLDHSMIFVFIGGTYTPFCLGAMGLAWGISLLAVVWTLVALGVAMKVAWPRAPRWLGVGAYLAVGWVAIAGSWELAGSLPVSAMALLVVGGLVYSLGGVVYAVRWPNPLPRVFGFHEVFHAMVVAGSAVFYAVAALYVIPG
ncbi:MAG: hemolysin III family protein [Chloroflexi bacterium]|nr:hemolysin III family protein [Chloroflexota bacterium]